MACILIGMLVMVTKFYKPLNRVLVTKFLIHRPMVENNMHGILPPPKEQILI